MIEYILNPEISSQQLNELFSNAWENHLETDFTKILELSFGYFCAFENSRLIGFVKLIWDGGVHAFLLDTTVHLEYQKRGIGGELVNLARAFAQSKGCHWLHVDFEPHLKHFYESCGFKHTEAGLIRLEAQP
jgi:GNAT superfamily N-acetyltransferase